MKNREIFLRDPATAKLMNNGQARINDGMTAQEWATLRDELSNFVCEGQYADGMVRILEAFLGRVGGTECPSPRTREIFKRPTWRRALPCSSCPEMT